MDTGFDSSLNSSNRHWTHTASLKLTPCSHCMAPDLQKVACGGVTWKDGVIQRLRTRDVWRNGEWLLTLINGLPRIRIGLEGRQKKWESKNPRHNVRSHVTQPWARTYAQSLVSNGFDSTKYAKRAYIENHRLNFLVGCHSIFGTIFKCIDAIVRNNQRTWPCPLL